VYAELGHEALYDAEESHVGEEAGLDQVIEPVGAEGGPGAGDFYDEIALGGGEFNLEVIGSFFGSLGRVFKNVHFGCHLLVISLRRRDRRRRGAGLLHGLLLFRALGGAGNCQERGRKYR